MLWTSESGHEPALRRHAFAHDPFGAPLALHPIVPPVMR
jgi:hypothetical protein